jgi:predicted nucleic acid-binding protein
MILVDTSVLIDLFCGHANQAVADFQNIVTHEIPFGISSIIFQEILQGAKTEKEFKLLYDYLSSQRFFNPKDELKSYGDAAQLYFKCRREGITIRSTIDCLIAQTAIEHGLSLLHNDRDFTFIAQVTELRIFSPQV